MNFRWRKGGDRNGRPGYILEFDFDYDVVEKLKAKIPSDKREWRPYAKEWWVAQEYEKQINDLFPGFLEAVIATKPFPGFE